MKLENYISAEKVVQPTEDLEEKFFSIGDAGLVFDVLRSKMYSDPIAAVCREISCNARDANIEAGNENIPIQIHLPNSHEPYYKIKDSGPGISPDRIENIFIKYGASSKRDDNRQVGAFGLGAKSVFACTDNFTIITVHNGIKYNYSCFIDETKIGKLALLSSSESTEPNGTEIIIPANNKFNDFIQKTEFATRHWKLKPIFSGENINYKEIKPLLNGNGWMIAESEQSYNRKTRLIIDGIEYPLDYKDYTIHNLTSSIFGDLYIYFNTGELTLSANREQIYLDYKTQSTIINRVKSIINSLNASISDKVNHFDNLWDAIVYCKLGLTNIFSSVEFLEDIMWKDISINMACKQLTSAYCDVDIFSRTKYTIINERYNKRAISLRSDSLLVINDISDFKVTVKHVTQIFDENPGIVTIEVISPLGAVTEELLNDKCYFNLTKPLRLSNYCKKVNRTKPDQSKLIYYKYIKSEGVKRVKYSSVCEDKNIKVICKLIKHNYDVNKKININSYSNESINFPFLYLDNLIIKYPNVSFYGIDSESIDKVSNDLISLEDFLSSYVTDSEFDFIKIAVSREFNSPLNSFSFLKDDYNRIQQPFADNSLFIKHMNVRLDLLNQYKDVFFLEMYEMINGKIKESHILDYLENYPEYNLENLNNKVNKKYPLLEVIGRYSINKNLDEVIKYIKLIDVAEPD